ncbi:transcriptional regulator, AraC family [Paenibacillus mucilaginosus 3016]|uniref:Transcriptional regulator, AraC family n=1 Tax=Paenibacillus mucilaginosus 3016 TaxID=1116391 RepID=H6NBC8_9BACL|nr:transcriptional regulator, AraC family [Paenibacillus mucilaginosus 3016]
MDIAKQLLEETALPLNDIAAKLQYAHTSAFIRAFRKLEGVTPGSIDSCGEGTSYLHYADFLLRSKATKNSSKGIPSSIE